MDTEIPIENTSLLNESEIASIAYLLAAYAEFVGRPGREFKVQIKKKRERKFKNN
jgi:hypothetical protein